MIRITYRAHRATANDFEKFNNFLMFFDDICIIRISSQSFDFIVRYDVDEAFAFPLKWFLEYLRPIANFNEKCCGGTIKQKNLFCQYIITYYEKETYFKTITDVFSSTTIAKTIAALTSKIVFDTTQTIKN